MHSTSIRTRTLAGLVVSAALLTGAACSSSGNSQASFNESNFTGGVDGGQLGWSDVQGQARMSDNDQAFVQTVRSEGYLPSVATDKEVVQVGEAVCTKLLSGEYTVNSLVASLSQEGMSNKKATSLAATSVAYYCADEWRQGKIN